MKQNMGLNIVYCIQAKDSREGESGGHGGRELWGPGYNEVVLRCY